MRGGKARSKASFDLMSIYGLCQSSDMPLAKKAHLEINLTVFRIAESHLVMLFAVPPILRRRDAIGDCIPEVLQSTTLLTSF